MKSDADRREYHRLYYAKNRDRIKARVTARHEARRADPVYQRARQQYQKKYYEAAGRGRRMKNAYAITPEQYQALLVEQAGRCAICDTDTPGGRGGRFHVDHCHVSGKVRGLLCTRCNVGLGQFNEDGHVLHRAISYLGRNRQ